jgi:hypothetical protein
MIQTRQWPATSASIDSQDLDQSRGCDAGLRREVQRLRMENGRLSRLLDLRGQNTAPAPEQLSAAITEPGLVTMTSPVADKLALYADRFRAENSNQRGCDCHSAGGTR